MRNLKSCALLLLTTTPVLNYRNRVRTTFRPVLNVATRFCFFPLFSSIFYFLFYRRPTLDAKIALFHSRNKKKGGKKEKRVATFRTVLCGRWIFRRHNKTVFWFGQLRYLHLGNGIVLDYHSSKKWFSLQAIVGNAENGNNPRNRGATQRHRPQRRCTLL